MRIFFDTKFVGLHQFTGFRQFTSPVSIGLVAENGRTFYAEFVDYDKRQVDSSFRENVIDKLYLPETQTGLFTEGATVSLRGYRYLITYHLTKWLNSFGTQLEMWSDQKGYNWVLFCQLWGDASALPKSVYCIPFDLSTLFKIKGIDPDIKRKTFALDGGYIDDNEPIKHNALGDAKVIKACYELLYSGETLRV